MMGRMKLAFPIIFGLFWTAIVGAFDVMIGLNSYRALRAEGFATTMGSITHSQVAQHAGDDGPTYGVDIRYEYSIDGRKLSGDTYRYTAGSSSDSDWAYEAVRQHEVGAQVLVHYDPDDPTDSVLRPGVDAGDLFLMLFMTPFNLVMGGLWWYGGTLAWHWWNGTSATAVNAFRDRGTWHARLPDTPPIATGFVAAGIAAFVSLFVVAFTTGFHPSMPFILIVWALVIATGIGTGFWLWRKQNEGAFDVLIGDRSIDLPATHGRERRETIERRAISGVAVQKVAHASSDGDSHAYVVSLQRRGGEDAKVGEWSDEESARQFAAWLSERLGLPHRSS